jgi:hypothetical protein
MTDTTKTPDTVDMFFTVTGLTVHNDDKSYWTQSGVERFPAGTSAAGMYTHVIRLFYKTQKLHYGDMAVLNYIIKPNTPEDARKWMNHGEAEPVTPEHGAPCDTCNAPRLADRPAEPRKE